MDDLNKNFLGVLTSGKINKFVMFEKMMSGKKYPFIISNTDRSDEGGTHWWGILNISPKNELLLFDSFGISGMKRLVVLDDKQIVGKVLKRLEFADRKDNKLTFVKLKFLMNGYERLTEKEISELSETAQDFFYLVHSFGKNEKIKFVHVWMLEDPIQQPHIITCGPFQICFYEKLLFPDKDIKIHIYKKLTNDALETLQNELFALDQENNEQIINEYIIQRQLQMT